jgi:hypothetical protein
MVAMVASINRRFQNCTKNNAGCLLFKVNSKNFSQYGRKSIQLLLYFAVAADARIADVFDWHQDRIDLILDCDGASKQKNENKCQSTSVGPD